MDALPLMIALSAGILAGFLGGVVATVYLARWAVEPARTILAKILAEKSKG